MSAAAAGPGVIQSTSPMSRLISKEARAACQSIGSVSSEPAGFAVTGGYSCRYSGIFGVILPRNVLALYSNFGEATQHGTILCASTWINGIFGCCWFKRSATDFTQPAPTRRGLKSATNIAAFLSFKKCWMFATGSPMSKWKGMFNWRRDASTSCKPLIMNPYWRRVASRKRGTKLNTTRSGTFLLLATDWAYINA